MYVARLSIALIIVIMAGKNLQVMADETKLDAPTFNPPHLKDTAVGDFGPRPKNVLGEKISAPPLVPVNRPVAGKLLHRSSAMISNPSVSIIDSSDVDFGPYMANLQRTIKRNWFVTKYANSKTERAVVFFKVNKNGNLSHLQIMEPSGSKEYDQAVLQSVKKAAPFGPLPAGADNSVGIEFTFGRTVFSGKAKERYRTKLKDCDLFATATN